MPFRHIEDHTASDGVVYTVAKHLTLAGETLSYQTKPQGYAGQNADLVRNHKSLTELRTYLVETCGCAPIVVKPTAPKKKMRDYAQSQKGYNAESAKRGR